MPFARIRFEQVNSDDPAPLTVQALLGSDGTPVNQFPYAGWWGKPNPTEWCWLVLFKPDGSVDFGGDAYEERKERFSEMNIFDRPVEKGSKYFMKHFDGSATSEFVVRDIDVLAE